MGGSDLDRAEEAEGQETNRDRRGRRSEDEDAETEERRPEVEMGGSAELVTSIDDNRCRDWESNERIKDKSPSRQICATRPKKYVKECENKWGEIQSLFTQMLTNSIGLYQVELSK